MRFPPTKAFLAALLFSTLAGAAFGEGMIGLTTSNQLVRFDSASPGTTQPLVPITGLVAGDAVVGIDVRPATFELFALGVNGATAHLYVVNPSTGAATQVGGNIALPASGGASGAETDFGIDFNPTVDRLRVVANNLDNFRLNPSTGALAGADTALSPGAPVVVGAAYTNNFAGATLATLYAVDTSTDQLVTIGGINGVPSPNGGVVTAVGALGVNPNSEVGFDISPSGAVFASFQVGGVSGLYTINLATGAATLVGGIGAGLSIRDVTALAQGGQAIPTLSPWALGGLMLLIAATGVLVLRSRAV